MVLSEVFQSQLHLYHPRVHRSGDTNLSRQLEKISLENSLFWNFKDKKYLSDAKFAGDDRKLKLSPEDRSPPWTLNSVNEKRLFLNIPLVCAETVTFIIGNYLLCYHANYYFWKTNAIWINLGQYLRELTKNAFDKAFKILFKAYTWKKLKVFIADFFTSGNIG